MKKLFYVIAFLGVPILTYAQQSPAADQNPRYQESQDRYSKMADSLVKWHGVTLQQTYKAYDWREARAERRKQRREWRHQERMVNGYDYGWGGYYNGYYDNFGYGSYYNNYRNNYYPGYYPYSNYHNRVNGWSVGVGFGW